MVACEFRRRGLSFGQSRRRVRTPHLPNTHPSTTVNSPPLGRAPLQRSSGRPASQFHAPATPSVKSEPNRKSTPPPTRPPTPVATRLRVMPPCRQSCSPRPSMALVSTPKTGSDAGGRVRFHRANVRQTPGWIPPDDDRNGCRDLRSARTIPASPVTLGVGQPGHARAQFRGRSGRRSGTRTRRRPAPSRTCASRTRGRASRLRTRTSRRSSRRSGPRFGAGDRALAHEAAGAGRLLVRRRRWPPGSWSRVRVGGLRPRWGPDPWRQTGRSEELRW